MSEPGPEQFSYADQIPEWSEIIRIAPLVVIILGCVLVGWYLRHVPAKEELERLWRYLNERKP